MEIAGKKAIVVGGASGFGRATAESLAKRGASVAVLDRPQSKGQEVADAIGGAFHEVDVTDFAGTEKVLQQAVDGLGGLHIIVTTAGGGIGERTITKDAAFPKRLGKPEEFAKLALAIVENPMLNGQCIRLDAGQRFAPK